MTILLKLCLKYFSLLAVTKTFLIAVTFLFCFFHCNFFIFVDLFEELVPMTVHQSLAAYEVRKNELVTLEINKLRESTQLLNRYGHCRCCNNGYNDEEDDCRKHGDD